MLTCLRKVTEEALDTALFEFSMVLVYDECNPRKVRPHSSARSYRLMLKPGSLSEVCAIADHTQSARQRDFHRFLQIERPCS